MKDLESIMRRIRALQSRTVARGCTEAEAMAAAKIASKLVNDHQLSMTDIEIGAERCDVEYLETGRRAMHEIKYCVSAITSFTDCKAWFQTRHGQKSIAFFGRPDDTAFAIFLVHTVKTAMDGELAAYKVRCREMGESTGRRRSHSFLLGMALRVAERLRALKAEQRQENKISTGRDLVVVKSALVQSEFRKLGIKLRSSSGGTTAGDSSGYSAGKAAGDRVGFNRPVGGNGGGYLIGRG